MRFLFFPAFCVWLIYYVFVHHRGTLLFPLCSSVTFVVRQATQISRADAVLAGCVSALVSRV